MKSTIILNINHSGVRIAVISKTMEVPNVYDADGVDTSLSLSEGLKITHSISTKHVDLDTGLVELGSFDVIDLTDKVEKTAIPDFLLSMKKSDWFVDENKETVEKLVFPKPKEVIKNENVVKGQKPKLLNLFYSFIFVMLVAITLTFFFNKENFNFYYIVSFTPILLLGSSLGHYISLRKYNKAKFALETLNN
jgi:hypothetical protein|tara:strand:- start:79244 stop:79822 length:579 start_codon:yes stop_codon:yes gene_type:complete